MSPTIGGHEHAAIVGVLRHWDDPVDVGCACKECAARKSLSDPAQIVGILAELLRGFGFDVWIDAAPRTRPPRKDEFAIFPSEDMIQVYLPTNNHVEHSRLLVMPQVRAITLQLLACATAEEALVVCLDECRGLIGKHERDRLRWALRMWRDIPVAALTFATSTHNTAMVVERNILYATNEPVTLATLIVSEAQRCGFEAVLAHETVGLEKQAWVVLTPNGGPEGGIGVHIETHTAVFRNLKTGRGWDLPTARRRLTALLDVRDGARDDVKSIFWVRS